MLRTNENIISEFVKAVEKGDQTLAAQYVAQYPQLFPFGCAAFNQALHVASYKDHIEIVNWLITQGADADLLIPDTHNRRVSLLQHLARHGRHKLAAVLLPHVKNINHINADGKTALHYAIDKHDLKMVELLQSYDASYFRSGVNRKNVTIDSPIAIIVKECKLDIAKLVFERYPLMIAECMKTCPNIISYICINSTAEHAARVAMIKYLITEFPETFLSANGELIHKEHLANMDHDFEVLNFPDEIRALSASRIKVNSFFLALAAKDKSFINKKLTRALSCFSHNDAPLLATDLVKVLKGKHPLMSADDLNQMFREILFISSPNPKLYTQLGKLLFAACNQLLKSAEAESEETKLLCKFTLLLLLRVVANSKEDLYREIAALMHALNPAISIENGFKHANSMNTVISNNIDEVQKLITELKAFYCNKLDVKLTDVQVNPCSAVESMIKDCKISKLQLQNLAYNLKQINSQNELAAAKTAQTTLEASNMLLQFANESHASEIARLNELLANANAANQALAAKFDEMQEDYIASQISRIEDRKEMQVSKKSEREEDAATAKSPATQAASKRHKFFSSTVVTTTNNGGNRRSARNK